MMEVTGKGRACMPEGPKMFQANLTKYICLKSRRKKMTGPGQPQT